MPSSPLAFDRRHALEGVDNFRDFGGYATACGRGVKPGRLFRSAQHAEASDADLAAIRAMGLSAVVDLRRPSERNRQPSRRWDGFAAKVIVNDHEREGEDQWIVALREGRTVFSGGPRDVMDPGVLEQIYGTPLLLVEHPVTRLPLIVPQVPGGRLP